MSDTTYVGQRVSNIDVSPQFQPYSRVIIHIDDDTQVSVGDKTGRTLEIDNPFGNREMANAILQSLSGYQYQPYKADGALLDPAAEIGDAIETPAVLGGIYSRNRKFGRLMKADVSAPTDEEINHEYVYESPTERAYKRQVEDVKASFILTNNLIQQEVSRANAEEGKLSSRITQTAESIEQEVIRATGAEDNLSSRIIQNAESITAEVSRATAAEGALSATLSIHATEIAAKVNASGGGGSFSWVLNSNSHTWKSNNTDVMRVSASGLWIKGTVEAASGKIGGFDIGATALSYNGLYWGDTSKNYGVYIGQSGIQLGKNFKVDNSGAVTAKNLAIQGGSISIGENFSVNSSGSITASNLSLKGQITFYNSDGSYAGSLSAANLREGAAQAYSGYSGWNNTSSYVNSNGGYWTGGAGGGYAFNNATNSGSGQYPYYFRCTNLQAESIFLIGKGNLSRGSVSIPSRGYVTVNGVQYYITFSSYYDRNVWVY